MSAFGGKAAIGWAFRNVRYWPKADISSPKDQAMRNNA
jgi:hypothetical protein